MLNRAGVSDSRGLCPAAGAVPGWLLSRRPAPASSVTRLEMGVAPADQLAGSRVSGSVRPVHTAIAISPDGRLVVFAATSGNETRLYARPADRAEATPIPGTENGIAPFFSPDGLWIGFWTGNTIKKVPAAGGRRHDLRCPSRFSVGASWERTHRFSSRPVRAPNRGAGGKRQRQRRLALHWLPQGQSRLQASLVTQIKTGTSASVDKRGRCTLERGIRTC